MKTNSLNKAVIGLSSFAMLAVVTSASAQQVLINPTTNNGSFETPASTVKTGFDAATDVPFWMNSGTTYADSGVDSNGGATDDLGGTNGARLAFLRSSEDGAFQMTTYVAQLGDVFTFSLDAAISYTNSTTNTSQLAFSILTFAPGATGTGAGLFTQGTSVASSILSLTALTNRSFGNNSASYTNGILTYTAQAADVGRLIGVAFDASSPANGSAVYTAVDNVNLTVSAVPEPSTWVMMAGGLGALVLVQSRRRRA